MDRIIVIALLLLAPQLASARVYMCVDHATGETSFMDKACETVNSRAEVRVDPSNPDSGSHYAAPAKQKTWRSQAQTRKTGKDYNAERRSIYEKSTTASTQ